MDTIKYNWLEEILYEKNIKIIKHKIKEIDNFSYLHILAANYNWDNGFDIPSFIITNKNCDLATALMLFYNADGYRMLEDKHSFVLSDLDEWKKFLISLYECIINKKFKSQNISFNPPLTKIQLFKFKKRDDIPNVFLESLKGHDIKIPKL